MTERRKHQEYRQVDVVRLVCARPQYTALPLFEVGGADRGRAACSRTAQRLGAGDTRTMLDLRPCCVRNRGELAVQVADRPGNAPQRARASDCGHSPSWVAAGKFDRPTADFRRGEHMVSAVPIA